MTTNPYRDAATVNPQSDTTEAEILMVSPRTAQQWLENYNTRNRPVTPAVIDRYLADITAGRWMFAGDPVRFTDERPPVLADGQHRLAAIAASSVTLPVLVVRGLDPASQAVMDQGRRRTPGNQLALEGIPNANFVASSVAAALAFELGSIASDWRVRTSTVTSPMIQEWVREHPQRIEQLQTCGRIIRSGPLRPSIGGAFVLAVCADNRNDEPVLAFLTLLNRLVDLGTDHPILALNARLQRGRHDGARMNDRDQMAATITAWNAWVTGRKMSLIRNPRGGWNARNYPVPVTPQAFACTTDIERGLELFTAA